MEDLRGRPRRILVDGRQLGPRPALPEGVHESEPARVREEEHRPEVGRRPRENRPGGGRPDRPLKVGDVGQRREVASLPAEAHIVREGDGLAFDQRLARDALVAPAGRGAEEALQVDEAVLEHVHELVGEGVSPELRGEPVREDHPLRDGIVVGGRLLGEEVGQEPRQVEIGGDETPGDERPALGVQPRRGVLPRSSPTTKRRRSSRLWMTSGGGPPVDGRPRSVASSRKSRAGLRPELLRDHGLRRRRAMRPRRAPRRRRAAGSTEAAGRFGGAGPRAPVTGFRPERAEARRRARPPRDPAGGWPRRSRRPRAARRRRGASRSARR